MYKFQKIHEEQLAKVAQVLPVLNDTLQQLHDPAFTPIQEFEAQTSAIHEAKEILAQTKKIDHFQQKAEAAYRRRIELGLNEQTRDLKRMEKALSGLQQTMEEIKQARDARQRNAWQRKARRELKHLQRAARAYYNYSYDVLDAIS